LIEGEADVFSGNTVFPIAGLPVDTAGLGDDTGFFAGDVLPLTRDDFFSTLDAGDRVRALGLPTPDALLASRVALMNFGNMTILGSSGAIFSGSNDLVALWDGTANTEADLVNGTVRENMTIVFAELTTFFGFPLAIHDVHVFGPGNYTIETCPEMTASCTPPQPVSFSVGPDQLGGHMLIDWGSLSLTNDMDVVVLWEREGAFPSEQLYPGPAGASPGPQTVWDLVSVDGDGDGIPGISAVDGPFVDFNWNFNLKVFPLSRP
jgi:hypothetical protein